MMVLSDDYGVVILALYFAGCDQSLLAFSCHADRKIPDLCNGCSLSSFVFFRSTADVVCCYAAFLISRTCQLVLHPVSGRKVLDLSYVSDRENILVRCTHESVDSNAASLIQFKTGILCKLTVRAQPDRKNHKLSDNCLAACESDTDFLLSVFRDLLE